MFGMHRMPRTTASLLPVSILSALVMLGALLAACGGSDDASSREALVTPPPPTSIPKEESPTATPEAVEGGGSEAEPGIEEPASTATIGLAASGPTPAAEEVDDVQGGIQDEEEVSAGDDAAASSPIPTPAASTVRELLALGRPLVIGHAGGDRSWPHSTMYAFSQAAYAGVDVLEMDLQMTADGVLVVHHDDTVDRATEGTGRVRDMTYQELQALDYAYWWSEEWPSHDLAPDAYPYRGIRTGDVTPPEGYSPDDFRAETFRAVAEAFPEYVLDVEIKTPAGDDGEDDVEFILHMAEVLAAEIEELGRTDSVVVVSFSDEALAAFREMAPEVVTSPGETTLPAWAFGSVPLHPNDLILQVPPTFNGIDVLTDALLAKATDEGLAVWVWPNDASQENPDYYAELIDLPVDGVIAGRPADAVERFRADGDIP